MVLALRVDAETLTQPVAVLESIRLAADNTELTLRVKQGAFDPILSHQARAEGGYRLQIEGREVTLSPSLLQTLAQWEQRFKQTHPAIEQVHLEARQQAGASVVLLTIETRERWIPQVRANTGSVIKIGLLQEGVSVAPASKALSAESAPPLRGTGKPSSATSATKFQPVQPAAQADARGWRFWQSKGASGEQARSEGTATVARQGALRQPFANRQPSFVSTVGEDTENLSLVQLHLFPERFSPPLLQAWQQFEQGSFEAMRSLLNPWLAQSTADASVAFKSSAKKPGKNNAAETTPRTVSPQLQKAMGHLLLARAFHAQGQPALAVESWQAACRTPWLLPHLDLAYLYLAQGNVALAQEHIQQAVAGWPQNPEVLYLQGLLAETRLQLTEAQRYYRLAMQQAPFSVLYQYRMAMVLLKLNQPQAAQRELEGLLIRRSQDTDALKALAYLYQKDQQSVRAAETYQTAMKPDILLNYALLLQAQKRFSEAMTLAKAADYLGRESQEIQYSVGMLFGDLKDPLAAKAALQRFLTLTAKETKAATLERRAQAQSRLSKL
ncbi:MAG: tetratricopeptide repeat protein [Candidatus Melainabacteria bacterium]|nr:tetratricopeptide repeat protein [Candidatus Melainabacteria bacterium]